MENIKKRNISRNELNKLLFRNNHEKKDQLSDEFISFLKIFIKEKGEKFEEFEVTGRDPFRLGKVVSLGDFVYNIDVTMATWTTIGLLLDIYLTYGVSSTLLGALGKTGKFIHELKLESGLLCNYEEARNLNIEKEFIPSDLFALLNNRECPFPKYQCKFNLNSKCKISLTDLQSNLKELEEKGMVEEKKNEVWKIKT